MPRVVVEDSVADEIRGDRGMKRPRWDWDGLVLQDLDGRMFVSYLPVIANDEIPGEVERGLAAHKAAIETALAPHSTNDRASQVPVGCVVPQLRMRHVVLLSRREAHRHEAFTIRPFRESVSPWIELSSLR